MADPSSGEQAYKDKQGRTRLFRPEPSKVGNAIRCAPRIIYSARSTSQMDLRNGMVSIRSCSVWTSAGCQPNLARACTSVRP
jgi:hypothetical protein